MPSAYFFVPGALLPDFTAADVDEDLPNSAAPPPAPTAFPGPSSQVPTDAGDPIDAVVAAQRGRTLRRLAPAPTGSRPKAEQKAPTKPKVPGKGLNGNKVTQACLQCRARKSKCPGEKPVCDRCTASGITCVYRPPRRRLGRKAMEAAGRALEPIERPESVRISLVQKRDLMGTWRNILPRPEAPPAAFERLTAVSEGGLEYAELDRRQGQTTSGSEACLQHAESVWKPGGMARDPEQGPLFSEFSWGFEGSNAPPNGLPLQSGLPQPDFAVGASQLWLNELLPPLGEETMAGGVQRPWPSEPLPSLGEEGMAVEGSFAWLDGNMQNTYSPGLGCAFNYFNGYPCIEPGS